MAKPKLTLCKNSLKHEYYPSTLNLLVCHNFFLEIFFCRWHYFERVAASGLLTYKSQLDFQNEDSR